MTIGEIKRFVESSEPIWLNIDGCPHRCFAESAVIFQPQKQHIFVMDTEERCARLVPISMLYPSRSACLNGETVKEWMCGDSVWISDSDVAVKGVITQAAPCSSRRNESGDSCLFYTVNIADKEIHRLFKTDFSRTELDCWYQIKARKIANSAWVVLKYQKYQLALDDIERKIASLQSK